MQIKDPGYTNRAAVSKNRFDAVALFSGGLDSILGARLVQEQGLKVLGLHFISPFFGKPDQIDQWEDNYGIPVVAVDISREYVSMICNGPVYGMGKTLNPCVDCKILMLTLAKKMMNKLGARFIISGEVLGQRPMSQRLDTLNIIRRDSQVKDILVRALSARHLPPTRPEKDGLIDRSRLGNISGRGRKEQLKLAEKFHIKPIPTPGGGCLLTEKESSRRYLPVLEHFERPDPDEFHLANTGRQFWDDDHWLCIGRNSEDNARLEELAKENDYIFSIRSYPGPLGLGRPAGRNGWDQETIHSASWLVTRFSPRARRSSSTVQVLVKQGRHSHVVEVSRNEAEQQVKWQEPSWDPLRAKALYVPD